MKPLAPRQVARTRLPGLRALAGMPRRLALGFDETTTPGLVFVALGAMLGPDVLNVVSAAVLARLDPVVSMALALLGVFVGAGLTAAPPSGRAVAAAVGQVVLTITAVSLAMLFLLEHWALPLMIGPVTAASVLALCSAASAAVHPGARRSPLVRDAAHIADLDDVPIVAVASLAVPVLAGVAQPLAVVALGVGAALTIALAGDALFRRAEAPPERGVFVTGTLLLLGGVAAYASLSPLTTGFVAGAVWNRAHRGRPTLFDADVRRLQRPLLALLLIAAGASIELSWALMWLAAPVALVRLAGKTAAALLFARIARLPAGLLSTVLLPPGLLGIALALNVQQVLGSSATLLVSAVTVSTLVSEIVARVVLSHEGEAP